MPSNWKSWLAAAARSRRFTKKVVLQDIGNAADVLRGVYDANDGADGFISLEVSPLLANDTKATIEEAKRLFASLNRPNVMIKVPGTPAGLPAVEELIFSGLNINITLIFAVEVYEQVAEAYIKGARTPRCRRVTGGPHSLGRQLLRQPN